MRARLSSLALALIVVTDGLGGSETRAPVRTPTPALPAGPKDLFADVTAQAGIGFVHQFDHERIANILLSNGSGGAVFDFDRDGQMDIYLVNWGPLAGVTVSRPGTVREPNRLYRNRGDGTFEDCTARAGLAGTGYGSAACAGDFDNDGHTDLYVVNVGQNLLYRNCGDGSFEDVTDKAGVGDAGTGIAATFVDIDNDGWLDLFVANYLHFDPAAQSEQNPGSYPGPLAYPGERNVLYWNRRNGTFEDVSRASGIQVPGHRAMSVVAFDADEDGDTDLYVSNDDTPNALWSNDGRGHFRDVAVETGVAFNSIGEACGSMNAAVGDVNGDTRTDLFVTRLGYGSLYVQDRPGWFEDRMHSSGLGRLTRTFVGWGGCFIDFDNDGDPDVFVANGDAFTLEGTTSLLLENRDRGEFADVSTAAGAFFGRRVQGRGSAVLDFDNDGRLDLLVTALADRPFLLRGRAGDGRHWLKLDLEGTRSNRSGYGAQVRLQAGERIWRVQALCPTGFLLQGDKRLHFGLGTLERVDRIEIRWPSGRAQTLREVPADQILHVREPRD